MIRGLKFYFLRGKEGLASDASDHNWLLLFFLISFLKDYIALTDGLKYRTRLHRKPTVSYATKEVVY